MKSFKLLLGTMALLLAWSTSVANAGLVYSVNFSSTSLSGATGTGWTVDVFLHETFAIGDSPILAPGGIGLLAGGFDVTLSDPSALGTIITNASGNAAFDFPTVTSQTNSIAQVQVGQGLASPGITGLSSGPTEYSLKIGTISGTFGNAGVASLSFDATTANYFVDFNLVQVTPGLGAKLDLFSITAIPEPSSALLTVVGIALAGFYRPNRKKV